MMGCDIHCYAEKRAGSGFEPIEFSPLDSRNYAVFGFLADVRNYSGVPPLAKPRGLPGDVSETVKRAHDAWGVDAHSASWLSVEEMAAFDYEAMTEDRRVTRRMPEGYLSGACTAEPSEGKAMSFREFLGPWFFKDLARLQEEGAERIVFWFDN